MPYIARRKKQKHCDLTGLLSGEISGSKVNYYGRLADECIVSVTHMCMLPKLATSVHVY